MEGRRVMARKSNTGDGDEYTDHDEAMLEAALDDAWQDYDDLGPGSAPTHIDVRAQIEWAGVEQGPGGMRSTTLGPVDLAPVKDKLDAARQATNKAAAAAPATSYTAKGWRAQLRALTGTTRGSVLADRAGLNPTARTVRNWLSESNAPSKRNQAKIAEAYTGLGTWQVDTARSSATTAQHELAEALTRSLSGKYGSTIRLRNIQRLNLEP